MKRKTKRNIFFSLVIMMAVVVYWWEKVYPMGEFQRLGEISFPRGTSVQFWSEENFVLSGQFVIPKDQFEDFKRQLEFKPKWSNKTVLYSDRCIHNRMNRVEIELDPKTAIVIVKINTPDYAGTAICDLESTL